MGCLFDSNLLKYLGLKIGPIQKPVNRICRLRYQQRDRCPTKKNNKSYFYFHSEDKHRNNQNRSNPQKVDPFNFELNMD